MRFTIENMVIVLSLVLFEAWFLKGYFSGNPEFEPAIGFLVALGALFTKDKIKERFGLPSENEERKFKLELREKEVKRKREQIQKWRNMVLDVQAKVESENDVGQLLQLHPDYLSLEPLLSDDARVGVCGDNRTVTVGSAFSTPLIAIKSAISRIQKEWSLS